MISQSLSFTSFLGQKNGSYPKPLSFQEILNRKNAFYSRPDYLETTKREFSSKSLPTSYKWNTESKIWRVVKQILSIIIFPVGLYQLLQVLAGKGPLLPASTPALMGLPNDIADKARSRISLEGEWKYKRITIAVDGYKIDATIMGKESTLHNHRWFLGAFGNGEFCENRLSSYNFKQIISEVKGNALVFNYPGVGSSRGFPSREAMAKAYRVMLTFLEDKKNGIGAKEIIGYGFSIGGGAQGDALQKHPLKKDIKYVFVKDRTFSDLSKAASFITNFFLGLLVKLLNWNMGSVNSSRKLQAPEIIMQSAKVDSYEKLKDSSKIRDDGVIPAKASLAKALLDDKKCPKENKVFIGMAEGHNEGFRNPAFLAKKIEAALK